MRAVLAAAWGQVASTDLAQSRTRLWFCLPHGGEEDDKGEAVLLLQVVQLQADMAI